MRNAGLSALATFVCLVATPMSAQSKRLSTGQIDKLLKQYFEVNGRTEKGIATRARLRDQLARVPPLSPTQVESWRKKLDKLWRKGPKLKKKGLNYIWEKEKRGKYIVGGKTRKPKGLAICMHGGGKGSGDAGSSYGAYDAAITRAGWLGIYPEVLVKTEHGWTDSGTEEFVLDLVDRALRTWKKLDPDKVYFIGHSMGGYGTWTLGAHHADRVAALAPSAGAPTPILAQSNDKPYDIVEGVIPNLRNVPIRIYQSDDDPRVPAAVNRVAADKLAQAQKRWGGYDFEYWEVTGRGHAGPPGGFEAQLDKIVEKTRQPLPEKIVWQPTLSWKQQFYWLWWDKPEPNAIVVAELDRQTQTIDIKTDVTVRGMHVLVSDAHMKLDREIVVRLNGKESWRGKPERSLAVLTATMVRGDPRSSYTARIPVAP